MICHFSFIVILLSVNIIDILSYIPLSTRGNKKGYLISTIITHQNNDLIYSNFYRQYKQQNFNYLLTDHNSQEFIKNRYNNYNVLTSGKVVIGQCLRTFSEKNNFLLLALKTNIQVILSTIFNIFI